MFNFKFDFNFDFNFNIIYNIHLHIAFTCLFSMLFVIYMFVVITIILFKIIFIVFAVYIFVVQLYIHQCNCHSYLISFFLFIISHLIFHIWSLYSIFIVAIHEIFHYICIVLIIWYFLSSLHLFVHNIFFILIIDYHSLDLLTLTELIAKFSTIYIEKKSLEWTNFLLSWFNNVLFFHMLWYHFETSQDSVSSKADEKILRF